MNCSSSNLRDSNAQKNATNKKKSPNASSVYHGVYYCISEDKWRVEIAKNHRVVLRKRYKDEELAARRYDLYVLFDNESHKPINFNDWQYDLILKWQRKLD